jgi:hypothetical protein
VITSARNAVINRTSPIPYFEQLYEVLRNRICWGVCPRIGCRARASCTVDSG